jgi:glycerophosphoryl diester phosphodiesterase
MVKFGRHLQSFLDYEGRDSSLYVVPYNSLKDSSDTDKFVTEWQSHLSQAAKSFEKAMEQLWCEVFQGISHLKEARGAVPDLALLLFIISSDVSGVGRAQELLAKVKHIHNTALINAEALRKLAKKFDKNNDGDEYLSPTLLPKLYASNFVLGQNLLESGIAMIREHLELKNEGVAEGVVPGLTEEESDGILVPASCNGETEDFDDEDDGMDGSTSSTFLNRRERDRSSSPSAPLPEVVHASRLNEFDWLKKMVQSCAPDEISHIVAHRGFHCINDNDDKRPLENSQTAYESAWTSGISLCECDIALTLDEKLVLAHDEDFTRLALDPRSEMSRMKVRDLTFKEIMALPLKSGTRPPLLIDILRSAHAIGEHAKLIVEIKPGNAEAGTALARMFLRHPKLMAHCAMVMSFDLYALHNLRKELHAVLATRPSGRTGSVPAVPGINISFPSSMSLGNFARIRSNVIISPTNDDAQQTQPDTHPSGLGYKHKHGSSDYFGVGMSVSQSDLIKHQMPPAAFSSSESPSNNHRTTSHGEMNQDQESNNNRVRPRRPSISPYYTLPKVMLLTVAEPTIKPCELFLDIMGDQLRRVDDWLKVEDNNVPGVVTGGKQCIDGIYVQYQPCMMTMEGARVLRELASRYEVGVWGDKTTPDDYQTFHWLVREGRCRYVNSDLPRSFKKKSSPFMNRGETMPI